MENNATAAPPAAPPQAPSVPGRDMEQANIFVFRGFNLLFLGSLFGKLADRLYQMAMVAAALVVFAGSSSENQLVYIQIVATVPLVFAYIVTNTLIDAVDRRKLMYGLMLVKLLVVFGFIPLLWGLTGDSTAAQLEFVHSHWMWGLAVVFLLSLIDAPFGPARAAAVPDVVPQTHFRLGASLMATSGLISLLLGTLIGGELARTHNLGPAKTILVAAGCYLFASALLMFLPAAVAVPGRVRHKAENAKPEGASGLRGLRDLLEGFRYSLRTRGIAQLIFFETAFWCLGSAYYFLFAWHLDFGLHLRADGKTHALSLVLGAAGIGLFLGAVSAGKMSRRVSPIVTYPAAFLIMAAGVFMTFHSGNDIQRRDAAKIALQQGDWVEVAAPGQARRNGRIAAAAEQSAAAVEVRIAPETDPVVLPRTEITLLDGALPHNLLAYLCAAGLVVGLGGGLMLGRVDADVLTIADERVRGRVFTIKAVFFTLAILGTMGPLTQTADPQKIFLAGWFTPVLLLLCVPALWFSWGIDRAIWAERGETELPGPFHRFGYAAARFLSWCLLKFFFRYEVEGAENIPAGGKCILVANHASFADPLFLGCATRRIVQWTMYASYYRSWAHPVFRFLRCIAVDEKSTLAALKANVRSLEQGACLGIFPEGRVSVDGKLQPPQAGAIFLAQRSGAPIVPAAIKGNFAAFPRSAKFPHFRKVRVIIGKPFTVEKDLSREEAAARANQMMADLAKVLETEPPPASKT